MKNLLLIVITVIAFSNQTIYAQENNVDNVLNKHFDGGADNFYKLIYTNVKYPKKARQNCVMGSIYANIIVNASGEIDTVHFMRKLGFGIEESIVESFELTRGLWKNKESLNLPFNFAFQIGTDDNIPGDIKVTAYKTVNGVDVKPCRSNKEILGDFNRYIEKGKLGKAEKMLQELLNRDPGSEYFNGLAKHLQELKGK